MDTYLLLRSNKQSGPYNLQQLVNLGLKPYDLVWVEGKSAAWRYPSEVDLLKDYAPKVEEQPYDRFYKKQEEKPAEKPVTPAIEQKVEKTPVSIVEQKASPVVEQKAPSNSPKKVFVAMPENHSPRVQNITPKAPTKTEEKPVVPDIKKTELPITAEVKEPAFNPDPVIPKQAPVYNAPTISSSEDATLNEKYSESLDEIKRRYTETYLNRKKRSKWTSTHTSIAQVFGGAAFFCLLVVFAYKNFAGEEKTSPRTTIIQPDRRAINTSTVSTTQTTIPAANAETKKQAQKKKVQPSKENTDPADENNYPVSTAQHNNDLAKESEIVADDYVPEKKAVLPAPDEEKAEKTEIVKPKTKPVNIRKLVNVSANNYKQRAFGGVTNLELTVNNDSKFDLDRVTVELQYLKPSEQPIKTETIVFSTIGANESKTLKIPDYLRGVKIAYRVTGVESSQYERQTAGL